MNIANFFQGFVILAWLLAIVIGVTMIMRSARNQPTRGLGRMLMIMIVAALVLSVVSAGLVFVNPQERGVVISALAPNGYREGILQPGLRWIIPFAERVITYPISRQTYTMSSVAVEGALSGDDSIAARTADGQEINIDASVIYSIDPTKVTQLHIEWQNRYGEELVRPLVRGVIRDGVSQFGVEEVYSTRRDELQTIVTTALAERMADNSLVLQEFILRDITFSPEYASSVEQKQIAEQLAQQAAFVVEQKRQEAEQARQIAQGQADAAVIAAKGDAESRLIGADAEARALELIAAALADNQDLLNYQYITRLSPNVQVMLLPSDSPFLLPFPGLTQAGPAAPTAVPTVVAPTEPAPTPTPTTP